MARRLHDGERGISRSSGRQAGVREGLADVFLLEAGVGVKDFGVGTAQPPTDPQPFRP